MFDLHHNVHARQLRPNLSEDANVGAIDHVRFEQLEVRYIRITALEFAHVFDLLEFLHDKGRFAVAFGVDESEDVVAVFPSVLAGQPSDRC